MQPILLIEDNEDDVFFMKRAFKANGVANPLHVAHSGQEAIDFLEGKEPFADRSLYPAPGLILLDLKLPYLDGFEVLRWIRERPELEIVPVIILTSSNQEKDIETAYRCGANSYLVKPPNADKLAHMVGLLKEYWLTLNHFPPFRNPGGKSGPPDAS
jgi:CheY-like chemotaxis protein